jgi:hypothetical protein
MGVSLTDGGGRVDGIFDVTPAETIVPTGGGGRPDVRCRWDWGSSSTCYGWPSRSCARSPRWRWLPLRRTPSASTMTCHLAGLFIERRNRVALSARTARGVDGSDWYPA